MPRRKSRKKESESESESSDDKGSSSEEESQEEDAEEVEEEEEEEKGEESSDSESSASESSGSEEDESYAKNRKGEKKGMHHGKKKSEQNASGLLHDVVDPLHLHHKHHKHHKESSSGTNKRLVPTTSKSFQSHSGANRAFRLVDLEPRKASSKVESSSSAPAATPATPATDSLSSAQKTPQQPATSSASSAQKPATESPAAAPSATAPTAPSTESSSASRAAGSEYYKRMEEEMGTSQDGDPRLELLKALDGKDPTRRLVFNEVQGSIVGSLVDWDLGGAKWTMDDKKRDMLFMPKSYGQRYGSRIYGDNVDTTKALVTRILFSNIDNETKVSQAVYIPEYDFFNTKLTPDGMKEKCMFIVPKGHTPGPIVAYSFDQAKDERLMAYATNDHIKMTKEQVRIPKGEGTENLSMVYKPTAEELTRGTRKGKLYLYVYIEANAQKFGYDPTKNYRTKKLRDLGEYVYIPTDVVFKALNNLKTQKLDSVKMVDTKCFSVGIYPSDMKRFSDLCGTKYDISGSASKGDSPALIEYRKGMAAQKEACINTKHKFTFTITVECIFLREVDKPVEVKVKARKIMTEEDFLLKLQSDGGEEYGSAPAPDVMLVPSTSTPPSSNTANNHAKP